MALAGAQKSNEAIAQLNRALEIDGKQCVAMSESAMVYKHQLEKLGDALTWAKKYASCKGGNLDDSDPMKIELENIKNEMEAAQMAAEAEAEAAAEEAKAKKAPGDG